MRVLITGATGFLGRHLARRLRSPGGSGRGHELWALARDVRRAKALVPELERAHFWDALAGEPPPEALGVDAVVHLAGETIAGRWTPEKKRRIYDSRVLGTRHLVEGLARLSADERPKALITASAVGYYGDRGDELLTEDAPPGQSFLAKVCQDWEREAQRAEALGMRVVRLRFGLVLGRDGGALPQMLPLFRWGLGGPLGSGRQWWSWVHVKDAVGLIVFALEDASLEGAVNAVAPEPVRQRDFAKALGRALRRPAVVPTPAWALRLALGEFAGELLASVRAIPQKAQEAGYRFQHPELEGALDDLLSQMG